MKTAVKNVERAVNSKDKKVAEEKYKVAVKAIDKAAQKGAVKKNTCARSKSRLSKKINEM